MSTDGSEAPKTHEELNAYARARMRDLIKKYRADGDVFRDEKPTGLIYRCAGSVALLLLVNGFEDLNGEEGWAEIVRGEFAQVYDHIERFGFDASPLKETAIFSPQGSYQYLDSVSWALSFALHLRLAQRMGNLHLEDGELTLIKQLTKRALEIIRDGACQQGGWGFTGGVTKPDLYYSYAVSESLADFGDYVLGESEDELDIKKDVELAEHLGKELLEQVQEKRKLTAKWLVEDYLPLLGDGPIDPKLEKDAPKRPHILLYYTYFVLDMLIVNLPDTFLRDEFFHKVEHQINKGVEHGLYLSRINFDKAHDDPDWWNDYISSSLELSWENLGKLEEKTKLLGRMDTARTQIYEPGLVPLSVRCNALYAFYIAQGADKKMSALFRILHDNRDPKSGLWDAEGYSLMVTERAIEALVDYNDYLSKWESGAVEEGSAIDSAFRSFVRDAVKQHLQSAGGGTTQREADVPAATAAAQGQFTEEEMLTSLTSILTKVSKHVENGKEFESLRGEKVERFCRTLGELMMSLFYNWLKAGVKDDNKHPALLEAARDNLEAVRPVLGSQLSFTPKVNEIPLLALALTDLFHRAVSSQGQAQTSELKPKSQRT